MSVIQNDLGLSRLREVLSRAKHAAEIQKAANEQKARCHQTKDLSSVSEDYADRLVDRARFRALLQDDRLDGARFRFYFQHIERSTNLDQLRDWIDAKMEKFGEHAGVGNSSRDRL